MNNSLFNTFNQNQMPMPQNRLTNMINSFNQFRTAFSGNPEQRVKSMLQNGQMSQQQFEQFAQMANQLRPLIK